MNTLALIIIGLILLTILILGYKTIIPSIFIIVGGVYMIFWLFSGFGAFIAVVSYQELLFSSTPIMSGLLGWLLSFLGLIIGILIAGFGLMLEDRLKYGFWE